MGLLTFGINVTLNGCVDHQEGMVDDKSHALDRCFAHGDGKAKAAMFGQTDSRGTRVSFHRDLRVCQLRAEHALKGSAVR